MMGRIDARTDECREGWVETGADEQELATPILSLCHGIFTD